MKQKFSIAMSLAVILSMLLNSLALADTISGDVVGGGSTVSLGTINPGGFASNNTSASLTVTCSGQKHATIGSMGFTVTTTLNPGSTGSVSEVSVTPTLSVPSGWPADGSGCPDIDPSQSGNQPPIQIGTLAILVTVPAGASGGARSINIKVSSNDGDVSGNANFTVNYTVPTVQSDTTPPVLSLPSNITTEATGSDGALVNFTASANDAVDGAVAVSCAPASGSTFPLGTTTVNCSATDAAGNSASGSFSVTVVDTTPPTIDAHGNETAEATSAAGAMVSYTNPASHDLVSGDGVASCAPASGSTFALGNTTVYCNASDGAGNAATQTSFMVSVVDTTAPALTLPDDITEEATGPSGALVSYTASASDLVDGPVAVNCSPASGSTFALGTTLVSCSATDAHSNTANGSFNVIVADTTAPVLALPDDITEEATGPSGAVVSYSASASDLVDGPITPSCSPLSGATFPLGTTPVNCSAIDAHSNTATGSFNVTVEDTTAPTIDPHGNETAEATSAAGAVVIYSSPATHDLVDGDDVAVCLPASGSTFPLGTTTVDCSATDAAGNTSTSSFNVTVEDTTPPTIDSHANVGPIEATGPTGAVATYSSPATHDLVDGDGVATCSPASGSTFALGTTTVDCSATDAAGNTSTSSFNVTVVDTTPPSVTVPSNMTVQATGPSGAVVNFTASASDIVDGALTPTCVPASGSTFPIGTTTVTCSATDAAGNTGSASFSIKVTLQPSGFYQPVDMGSNVWNTVKNGSTVPFKFELFAGSTELKLTSYVSGFTAQAVACPTSGYVADAIEVLVTGGTSLRFDTTGDQFVYNWQTPKKAGACYRITMTTSDGSTLSANFILK